MDTILHIGKVILLIFAVLMIFNLMILVHEWGHFLAARWRGLKIEKFQIWFGKPIWKKTINGVQYGLGSIPAGGFVALPQMAPMELLEGHTDESGEKLPKISPMDKIIVAIAGPLFSLLLALFFAVIVYFVGKPVDSISATTTIGWVMNDSPASEAGFMPGDEVLKVDGYDIQGFFGPVDTITERVVHSREDKIHFIVKRDGKEVDIYTGYKIPESGALERKGFRQVGLSPAAPTLIFEVFKGSPAELAGLEAGDKILAINDQEILSPSAVSDMVAVSEGKVVKFVVERSNNTGTEEAPVMTVSTKTFEVTPVLTDFNLKKGEKSYYSVGILSYGDKTWTTMHPGPLAQISDGAKVIARTLGALFSPKSDVGASHLSGPVGIGNIYYRLLDNPERGLQMALWFSVLLNVNLAMLNMMPFPVLDGGHITMAIMESIRRKPLNFRALEYIQAACALLLLGFMAYVTIFDSRDAFESDDEPKDPVYEISADATNREIPAN
jgi:regulator of sigma E protease